MLSVSIPIISISGKIAIAVDQNLASASKSKLTHIGIHRDPIGPQIYRRDQFPKKAREPVDYFIWSSIEIGYDGYGQVLEGKHRITFQGTEREIELLVDLSSGSWELYDENGMLKQSGTEFGADISREAYKQAGLDLSHSETLEEADYLGETLVPVGLHIGFAENHIVNLDGPLRRRPGGPVTSTGRFVGATSRSFLKATLWSVFAVCLSVYVIGLVYFVRRRQKLLIAGQIPAQNQSSIEY